MLPSNLSSSQNLPDLTPLPWNAYGFDVKETITVGDDKFNVYRRGNKGPLFLCIHGLGYTGLSFAQLAEVLHEKMEEYQIVAPDLRGHGETVCAEPLKLSKDQITTDIVAIYKQLYPDSEHQPYTFIIGHSMGGAMAIRISNLKMIPNCIALVVIDVVEGTALDSLNYMTAMIRRRPKSFATLKDAIEWATTHNHDCWCKLPGARQSIPSQLCFNATTNKYKWIIDLALTQPFWHEWFAGISQEFLQCSQGKILIVGGIDSLDTTLTRAEMEGKFQNVVIRSAGHAIHENMPNDVCDVLASYYHRLEVLCKKNFKI